MQPDRRAADAEQGSCPQRRPRLGIPASFAETPTHLLR